MMNERDYREHSVHDNSNDANTFDMTKEISKGKPLIDAIHKRKWDLGVTTQEAATAIELSPPYFQAMLSGTRPIQSMSDSAKRKLAGWLGVSTVDVYIMAETLEPSDFLVEQDLGDRMRLTLLKMSDDPTVRQFAPSKDEWESLSERSRFFICMLYERMFEREILQKIQRKEWVLPEPETKKTPKKPATKKPQA